MAHLELNAIAKSFGTHEVLKDFSLTVQSGEIIVIFGASGTGKTVLLRLIAGVEELDRGTLVIDGTEMSGIGARRGPAAH